MDPNKTRNLAIAPQRCTQSNNSKFPTISGTFMGATCKPLPQSQMWIGGGNFSQELKHMRHRWWRPLRQASISWGLVFNREENMGHPCWRLLRARSLRPLALISRYFTGGGGFTGKKYLWHPWWPWQKSRYTPAVFNVPVRVDRVGISQKYLLLGKAEWVFFLPLETNYPSLAYEQPQNSPVFPPEQKTISPFSRMPY